MGGWVELDYKRNRKECKTIELSSKEVFGTLINIIIRLGTQKWGYKFVLIMTMPLIIYLEEELPLSDKVL